MLSGIKNSAGNALYQPKINKVLAGLNNKQGMVPIAVLDLIFSSGRIWQEFDRDYNGGKESLYEELTTTAIWAGGIPAGVWAANKMAPKITNNLALPNLDLTLFPKEPNVAQKLTPPIIEKYLPEGKLTQEISSAARENLKKMASTVGKDGSNLLLKNRIFQFAKISGIGCGVSAILGFGLPKLNQHITNVRIANQQKKAQEAKQAAIQPAPNPFNASVSNLNNFATPMATPTMNGANPFAQTAFAANANPYLQATPLKANAGGIHFGGGAELVGNALQHLQNSDKLSTLLFSDVPLSSGRILTTRNKDEQIEKIIKEVGLIGILFFLASNLENKFSGKLKDVTYPGLKYLFNTYGEKGKTDLKFIDDYKNTLAGKSKLIDKINDHPEFIEKVRDYFDINNVKNPRKNSQDLLFEVAHKAGKIPTFSNEHIDITKKIDVNGIKAVAEFLDNLAGKAGKVVNTNQIPQEITHELKNAALHKFGAFAGSTAICWGLMSYALPKFQHWVTFKRTGKDFFPGVQPSAQ